MKMENLQQRREELERKELQLKDSLLKFDKFLKENDMKRARALKKTKDEQDAVKTKDREIDRWVWSVGGGRGGGSGVMAQCLCCLCAVSLPKVASRSGSVAS